MTEITESMIERGARVLRTYTSWSELVIGASHNAARDILTAALNHDDTESKEKQTMQKDTEISEVRVRTLGDIIVFGSLDKPSMCEFTKESAPDLIAFIQQWLDHDPEEELRETIEGLRVSVPGDGSTDRIIAAVREHDRKYGRPE